MEVFDFESYASLVIMMVHDMLQLRDDARPRYMLRIEEPHAPEASHFHVPKCYTRGGLDGHSFEKWRARSTIMWNMFLNM